MIDKYYKRTKIYALYIITVINSYGKNFSNYEIARFDLVLKRVLKLLNDFDDSMLINSHVIDFVSKILTDSGFEISKAEKERMATIIEMLQPTFQFLSNADVSDDECFNYLDKLIAGYFALLKHKSGDISES